jgi:hypothetical protein
MSKLNFIAHHEGVRLLLAVMHKTYNAAHPFVWTATADSIFAKVRRLCERISGTGH